MRNLMGRQSGKKQETRKKAKNKDEKQANNNEKSPNSLS